MRLGDQDFIQIEKRGEYKLVIRFFVWLLVTQQCRPKVFAHLMACFWTEYMHVDCHCLDAAFCKMYIYPFSRSELRTDDI